VRPDHDGGTWKRERERESPLKPNLTGSYFVFVFLPSLELIRPRRTDTLGRPSPEFAFFALFLFCWMERVWPGYSLSIFLKELDANFKAVWKSNGCADLCTLSRS